MRKTNNGFLKIAQSSHNFFLYNYRLVLTVGAIIYYDLAADGIGPPRWPVKLRDDLRHALAENGIGSAIYYPLGLHEQPCFEALGYQRGQLPETEAATCESLALPIYPELSTGQLDAIAETLGGFRRRQ